MILGNLPFRVKELSFINAALLSLAQSYSCLLLNSGRVKFWGSNKYGKLGIRNVHHKGDGANRTDLIGVDAQHIDIGDTITEVKFASDDIVTQISAGSHFSCALLATGRVKYWGNNFAGQLGIGSKENIGYAAGDMYDINNPNKPESVKHNFQTRYQP